MHDLTASHPVDRPRQGSRILYRQFLSIHAHKRSEQVPSDPTPPLTDRMIVSGATPNISESTFIEALPERTKKTASHSCAAGRDGLFVRVSRTRRYLCQR